jgi:hypothetical protein
LILELSVPLYLFLYDKNSNPENRHNISTVYAQAVVRSLRLAAGCVETVSSCSGLQGQGGRGQLQSIEYSAQPGYLHVYGTAVIAHVSQHGRHGFPWYMAAFVGQQQAK